MVIGEAVKRGPRCPLRTRCQLLLTDIQRNPLTEWFRRDDWREYGDAYLVAIQKADPTRSPMDLDTVQRRFDTGAYDMGGGGGGGDGGDGGGNGGGGDGGGGSGGGGGGGGSDDFDIDRFAKDVRTIWQNAIAFNGPHSSFGAMATVVQGTFENGLKHVRAASRPADAPADVGGAPDEIARSRKRRRELHDACVCLPAAEAAEMAALVQEANLNAVIRRSEDGRKDGEGLMEVNLDRLSGDQCAALLERARELAALASEA